MENIQLKLILFLMCVFMYFISLYQLQERVWVCVQSFNSNSKTNKNLEVMHGVIPTTLYLLKSAFLQRKISLFAFCQKLYKMVLSKVAQRHVCSFQ